MGAVGPAAQGLGRGPCHESQVKPGLNVFGAAPQRANAASFSVI
jgi:hypothetical protein